MWRPAPNAPASLASQCRPICTHCHKVHAPIVSSCPLGPGGVSLDLLAGRGHWGGSLLPEGWPAHPLRPVGSVCVVVLLVGHGQGGHRLRGRAEPSLPTGRRKALRWPRHHDSWQGQSSHSPPMTLQPKGASSTRRMGIVGSERSKVPSACF